MFERPDQPTAIESKKTTVVTPRSMVLQAICLWAATQKKAGGNGRLPPPMPVSYDDAADWWVNVMQERDAGGPAMIASVLKFIELEKGEREFIVSGVKDGIMWRGEPVRLFAEIVERTMRMREMGRNEYMAEVLDDMERKGMLIGGFADVQSQVRRFEAGKQRRAELREQFEQMGVGV